MKRILTLTSVMIASALMLTACTKCTQNPPSDTPAVVEPPQGTPPPTEDTMPGDVSAGTTAPHETAPAK